MALDDILQAITDHASRELAEARTAHARRIVEMRETSERETARQERDIREQNEEEMALRRRKAATLASTLVRNAGLQAKRSALNDAYASVAEALAKLPDARLEPLLKACIDSLPERGEIRPSPAHAALCTTLAHAGHAIGKPIEADGGFLFTSPHKDVDCTLRSLVERVLRPLTELETSAALFA